MSVGRAFVINELRRLEMHFHPDGPDDEIAVEYMRAAIQALNPKAANSNQTIEDLVQPQLRKKAS
jgi:hypothetical protein